MPKDAVKPVEPPKVKPYSVHATDWLATPEKMEMVDGVPVALGTPTVEIRHHKMAQDIDGNDVVLLDRVERFTMTQLKAERQALVDALAVVDDKIAQAKAILGA